MKSTQAVRVLKMAMNNLTRRGWAGKILHNTRLKVQCPRSAIPQAWELTILQMYVKGP